MNNNLIIYKIFKNGDEVEKKLLKNHIYAISILIFMVISSYIIITDIINTQRDGAELINISGKQRMYTQKVLASYYNYEASIKQIEENLLLLNDNNKVLIQKLENKNSLSYQDKFIKNLFYKQNGILETYESYKKNLHNRNEVKETCKKLFLLYDESTNYYQNKMTQKVDSFLLYETIILLISLITIILEGAYIFRPTIVEVFEKHNELKNLNNTLNEKVIKQVNSLREQEKILIQQAKMAEMGEMLSDISHQWKQPLTILSMQLETIQLDIRENSFSKEQLDSDFEESFKLIKHMHQTIEDFKNFYKPDRSKKTFNVVQAIKEVIKMEKTTLNRHTIHLEFNTNDEKINLHGYEGQFKQVILTIINNAIEQIAHNIKSKKQEKNKGIITILIKEENKTILIQIFDNAGGIQPKIINQIFNPYFSTKHDSGGSGIGLHMAKTILEKNFSGTIEVRNIEDGACFEIYLKLI